MSSSDGNRIALWAVILTVVGMATVSVVWAYQTFETKAEHSASMDALADRLTVRIFDELDRRHGRLTMRERQ